MKNVKLSDLIKSLEETINNSMSNKRIDDIGEMHRDFANIGNQLVNEYNLQFALWGVRIKDEWRDIIKYDIDFIDDKRYKFERKGKFVSIKFKPLIEMTEEATLQELIIARNVWKKV